MKSLLVLVLLAALAPPAQVAPAAEIQVRTKLFEAGATPSAQPVKVDCKPGERAVGGGYTLRGQELRVTASYPTETSWIVEVVNAAKRPVPLDVSVSCLSGGTVEAVIVSANNDRVSCPSGAPVVGGGFQTRGVTANGSVLNSYPGLSESWVADGPSVTKVFAVCMRGIQAKRFATGTVNAVAGSATCVQEPVIVATCFYPRTGSQQVTCADGETPVMGGHRVLAGTMPPYAILAADTNGRLWTFRLAGSSRDSGQLTIEVLLVCLRLAAPPVVPEPEQAGLSWPVLGGAGLLLLILLILALALTLRIRRGRSAAAVAELDAVLTGQRTSLRYQSFREVL